MSAQCRHGLIRYECWQCRDEAKQEAHVSQVFAGGLVTAVQQLEALEKECRKLRQELDAATKRWELTRRELDGTWRWLTDANMEIARLRAGLEEAKHANDDADLVDIVERVLNG
jgi:uncharacterized protein (DUF3084 family)